MGATGFGDVDGSLTAGDPGLVAGGSSSPVSSPQPNSKAVTAKSKRCGLGRWALTMVAKKDYSLDSKHPSAIRQARKKINNVA